MKKHIPSILTLGNLTCGFLAIVSGDLFLGSVFLLVGILFDTMDGFFARALGVESELGEELDSLADVVSFGVAPAFLYSLIAPGDSWLFYIAPVLFLIGSALRLAKFNTMPKTDYFVGLATPFATLFLIGLFIAVQYDKNSFIHGLESPLIYFLIPFILMMLMLSPIKMFSLKSLDKGLSGNILPILCLLSFAALLIVDFRIAFSSVVIIYVFLSVVDGTFIRH